MLRATDGPYREVSRAASAITSIDGAPDLAARVVETDGIAVIPAPFWSPSEFSLTRYDESEPERIAAPNRGLALEVEHTMEQIPAEAKESHIQT